MKSLRPCILTFLILFTAAAMPARAGVAVINGLSHETRLMPGEEFRGKIEIQNTSSRATTIKLSQADYWFSHTGESRYDQPGSSLRSNAPWILLEDNFITLEAHEKRDVEYRMTAPQSDTLRGTYWSVIMVEGMEPPDTASYKKGISVSTVTRYAIQIITHIEETGTSDLQFLHLSLEKQENTPRLSIDISNTGERALRPETSLELIDENGISQGILRLDRKRIYPGTSAKFTFDLPELPPGSYAGVIVADCDEDHIFGTNVTVDL